MGKDKRRINRTPKSSKVDKLHKGGGVATATGGAILGGIVGAPWAGALAGTLYSAIIKPPLTKRMEEWMNSISERLEELELRSEGFKMGNLSNRPFFITTFSQATQIAIRNHQKEKLEALRNIVINSARPTFPEDDVHLMFIHWIDIFTPWHIKILNFLNDIELRLKDGMIDTGDASVTTRDRVISNFPELRDKRIFANQIINDLANRGLILDIDPDVKRDENGNFYASYTTSMGKEFLNYISF